MRTLELYRRGFITRAEAVGDLLNHVTDLCDSGHLMPEEANACIDQIERFGNGEINANTLQIYVGMVV